LQLYERGIIVILVELHTVCNHQSFLDIQPHDHKEKEYLKRTDLKELTMSSNVKQQLVSYRVGEFTSKVSIQPAIFEALEKKLGSFDAAYEQCVHLAAEAKRNGVAKVSSHVQELVLAIVLPSQLLTGYKYKENSGERETCVYKHPTTNRNTKLCTFSTLTYALDAFSESKSASIYEKVASDFIQKKEQLPDTDGQPKKKEVSFEVREHLIRMLTSDSFQQTISKKDMAA